MSKLIYSIAVLIVIINTVTSQCIDPFVKSRNGYNFNYCYHRIGDSKLFADAKAACDKLDSNMVMPKDTGGLEDLYSLYKAYPNYFYWVGATASIRDPKNFTYLDGTPVPENAWCEGHPAGGDNLCAYYSTTLIIGRERCISTSPCQAKAFDHGIICQQK